MRIFILTATYELRVSIEKATYVTTLLPSVTPGKESEKKIANKEEPDYANDILCLFLHAYA
jgi:hypothetical protein